MSLPEDNIWDFDEGTSISIGLYPDAHCFPGHDTRPVQAIARWFAEEQVDMAINIGDFNDMGSLSSYDKGSKKMEGLRVSDDLEYSQEMLDLFDRNLRGHECHKVITLGNHEDRLFRLQSSDPQMDGVFGDDPFSYKAYGYTVYDYLAIMRVNGVSFSHTFINPTSLMGSIQGGSADIRMRNIGFPHVAGHQHGPLIHGQRMLGDGSPLSTLILGCAHTENHAYWGAGRDVYRGAAILRDVRGGSYDPDIRYLGNIIRKYL